jgi:sarcosine oxidase subunit beta
LGHDFEYRVTGRLRTSKPWRWRAVAAAARLWGLDIEELGANELAERLPGIGPGAIVASFSPIRSDVEARLHRGLYRDAGPHFHG